MSLDVYLVAMRATSVYDANITHNLGDMTREVGIYQHLWRPEELGIVYASELIELLTSRLALLKSDPERFRKFDAPNGWGRYEHLVRFTEEYLAACQANPDATVSVSR